MATIKKERCERLLRNKNKQTASTEKVSPIKTDEGLEIVAELPVAPECPTKLDSVIPVSSIQQSNLDIPVTLPDLSSTTFSNQFPNSPIQKPTLQSLLTLPNNSVNLKAAPKKNLGKEKQH